MTLRIGKYLVFWILSFMASQCHAQLSVTVDRQQISEAEILRLTIRVDNPTKVLNPDFSVLERDFNIVSRSGPNRKSSITYSNGRNTSVSSVSWELALHPRRLGRLTIPSFSIANMMSQPITVEVTRQSMRQKRATEQLVFFETTVDRSETYVQGQIIYTIKLFYVENISGDFPGAPDVSNTVVETIENERRYEAIRNGRRYYVLEKRYAIYPQRSGPLTIPRQAFSGSKLGRGFFSTREPVMTLSKTHAISVKPKPVSFPGDQWLPARSLQISESWSEQPPVFKVGEPVNRTLMIRADGLAASLLPPFENIAIDGTKTYRDPPVEDQKTSQTGIVSSRTTIVGIVPTQPGTITIPEIRVPWWNTETDSLELATIPESTFEVEAVTSGPASIITPLHLPADQTTVKATEAASITASTNPSGLWIIVSGVLALTWALTLLLWFVQYRKSTEKSVPVSDHASQLTSAADLYRRLISATQKNQAATSRNLLFLWGKARYPTIDSTRELARKLDSPQLEAEINELETCLYSPNANATWNGKALAELLAKLNNPTNKTSGKTALVSSLNPG